MSKATARSFLSNGSGGIEATSAATASAVSSGPLIEGNVATLGGIDCGDQVISIQHTENGAALCTNCTDNDRQAVIGDWRRESPFNK